MLHRTTGALATKLRPVAMAGPMAVQDRPPLAQVQNPPNLAGAVQGSLFSANVIAMPSRNPQPAKTQASTRQPSRAKSTAATTAPGVKARKSKTAEGQGELEFLPPVQSKPKTLGTTVEAMIYCEAPVAAPVHRLVAAGIDWAIVLLAYGLFVLTFVLCGGELSITRATLPIYAGTVMLIACTYGLFWTIAGTESFGMRFTHLRLITFDGFPPETSQRLLRLAGTALSLFSVLGILWSLADEEGLGWQDHMSRTFPTAHELESRVFRRR